MGTLSVGEDLPAEPPGRWGEKIAGDTEAPIVSQGDFLSAQAARDGKRSHQLAHAHLNLSSSDVWVSQQFMGSANPKYFIKKLFQK